MEDIVPIPVFNKIPESIAQISPTEIKSVFKESAFINLKGESEQTLFVSLLLHGNEVTGFYVLTELERLFRHSKPPRSILIFVGNVEACAAGVRKLPEQPDYNRIWKNPPTAQQQLVAEVLEKVKSVSPMACIDVHNNTGKNPIYACVTNMHEHHLYLASLFAKTIVFFENPDSVLVSQTNKICPSVVLECGPTGNTYATDMVVQYISDLLHIQNLDSRENVLAEAAVFHTVGRMIIPPTQQFDFGLKSKASVRFVDDLDSYNFSYIEKGALVAKIDQPQSPVKVLDQNDVDITDHFFQVEGDSLIVKKDLFPSMLTTDRDIIRHDCLGYLMEKIERYPDSRN